MTEDDFVFLFRKVFRNLRAFRAAYEDYGTDEIIGPGGIELNLHDLERLYEERHRLSRRQKEALELFLHDDVREKDVAEIMGVSKTNPVAIYATQGLRKMYRMIKSGEIAGFEDLIKERV